MILGAFANIELFLPHTSLRYAPILGRRSKRGAERLSNFTKVTLLTSGRMRLQDQAGLDCSYTPRLPHFFL
jgi:hypothetical protein